MLNLQEVSRIVHHVLDERLAPDDLRHLSVETRSDSMSEPAVFVVAEVHDAALTRVSGERTQLSLDLLDALAAANDERFVYFDVTSPADREEAEREDAA